MAVNGASVDIPTVDWAEFKRKFAWYQGEHVSLVGPTGSGKTTLALEILGRRKLMCVFANKPRDETMDRLAREPGWRVTSKFKYDPRDEKIILWPKGKDIHSYAAVQRKAYSDALAQLWDIGYWGIYFDEVRYVCDTLKLKAMVEQYWMQARALKISVVAGTQRPAFVPVMMFDQATHLFFWCDNDEHNLKRIGGLGALNAKLIRETVGALPPRTILYLNTRTGDMVQTKVVIDKKGTK